MIDLLLGELKTGAMELLAKNLNLDQNAVESTAKSLLPKAFLALQGIMAKPDQLSALVGQVLMGNFTQFLDNPEQVGSMQAQETGLGILKQFFGDQEKISNLEREVAKETALDLGVISKILPALTASVMGAIAKHGTSLLAGMGQGASAGAGANPLNDLLGGLMSGSTSNTGGLDLGSLAATFLKK